MPTLIVETFIKAVPEKCFDAARDIDLHCETAGDTGERAVAGVMHGMINLGESVTFEGRHLGVRQRLTAKIVAFDRPHRFEDEMTAGAFQSLRHIHEFTPHNDGTRTRDTLIWVSPLGLLGVLADKLFLKRHMKRFVQRRNAALKAAIESKAF